jgi:hypothetical protein
MFFIKKGTFYYDLLFEGKIKGSIVFFLGFCLVLFVRLTFIGFLLQLWGLFLLFKSFLPFIYDSASKLPVIGKYLSKGG